MAALLRRFLPRNPKKKVDLQNHLHEFQSLCHTSKSKIMRLYGDTHCPHLLALFFYIVGATSYSEIPQSVMYGDTTPGTLQLWQIKDTRGDGISFEARRAALDLHLKDTYHGKKLGDFSQPGTQRLKLGYRYTQQSKKSDALLEALETLELSTGGIWEIEISGREASFGNRTLLSNVLYRLPTISSVHWNEGEPIPLEIVRFLEARHPLCRLYYELPLHHWEITHTGPKIDRRIPRSQQPEAVEALAVEKRIRAIARESVLNSTILHSLKVRVVNGGREREP